MALSQNRFDTLDDSVKFYVIQYSIIVFNIA